MDRIRVTSLHPILDGTRGPGLYRYASRAQADTILTDLQRRGWQAFHIDGRTVHDKASFLQAAGAAMRFPDYYGHNWDAFEECVRDLGWAPTAAGYVLLYDHLVSFALRNDDQWRTARAILSNAVATWQDQRIPFYVLLRWTWWFARDLPWLNKAIPEK